MKISIISRNGPITVTIEGPDESVDKMVKATKSLLMMRKTWEAQMSFDKGKKDE